MFIFRKENIEELTTLAELVRYGIDIDENILLTDEERFAGSYNPKVELTNICNIVPWLKNIKCDYVSVSGVGISASVKFKIEFKQALELAGIKYNDTLKIVGSENVKQYKFPVIVKFRLITDFTESVHMAKVITIVNSQPVNLEKNETM
jgi:hypothetical protein